MPLQLVAARDQQPLVEVHEEPHLVERAAPVLGGERVHRQPLEADLERALDRVEQRLFDLSVQSTLDADLQKKTTEMLRNLKDSEYARAAGLYGHRMLVTEDPGKIIYSFTLSELTPQGAKFRIMADNFEQPLDINQGTKLDLGSTAKLRTLVTYLEIIETLHGKYASLEPKISGNREPDRSDTLSRWAVGYLLQATDKSLAAMLDAALDRKYSANPEERFFTGGGLHVFHNFKRQDDHQVLSVREATLDSVNLVYIRLMRDIVVITCSGYGLVAKILRDVRDGGRTEYLRRFAKRRVGNLSIGFIKNTGEKQQAPVASARYSFPVSARRGGWQPRTDMFTLRPHSRSSRRSWLHICLA